MNATSSFSGLRKLWAGFGWSSFSIQWCLVWGTKMTGSRKRKQHEVTKVWNKELRGKTHKGREIYCLK